MDKYFTFLYFKTPYLLEPSADDKSKAKGTNALHRVIYTKVDN